MKLKISNLFLMLSIVAILFNGCVQSINDPGGGTSTSTPKVIVTSPVAGDTIKAGRTLIKYSAVDKSGGPGIDYMQLYSSVTDSVEVYYVEDNKFPEIYLVADSTYIGEVIGYQLSAFNLDGESGSTGSINNIHVKKNTDPPDAPTNLQVTRKSSYAVNLLWDDNSVRETNYQISRKDGANGEYRAVKLLPANTISWDDNNLSEFVVYYYKVAALNQYGVSEFSNEVATDGSTGSNAPTNLQAQSLGASYVMLTWSNSTQNILGFKIQRKLDADNNWEQIAVVASDLSEYLDQGLIGSTKYNYRVTSYTGESQSAWSGVATVTTAEQDYYPPANLKANFNSNSGRVLITWDNNNPSSEINYAFIERKLTSESEYTGIGSVTGTTTSFVDSSVNYNTIYQYRARFYTINQYYTPYSNSDTAKVPLLPPKLTITEFEFGKKYFLEWTYNVSNEIGFQLYRKINAGNYELLRSFENNVTAYVDNVTDSTSIYYYKIRAYTQSAYLDFSNVVSTAGGTGNIIRPTGLTAAYDTLSQSVVLGWNDNSDNELAFDLQRKLYDTSNWSSLGILPADTETYTDSEVQRGNRYVYRVRARNSTDYSDYSDEVIIQVPY